MNRCKGQKRNTEVGCLASMALILIILAAPGRSLAVTRTWGRGGADELASNPNNWTEEIAPSGGESIMLNAGTSKNMTWDLDVSVQSWTQVGYAGTVTVATVAGAAGFTNFTILGNCVISNGVWTHHDNATSEAYRLVVTIGGDLSIGPYASIDVSYSGYDVNYGPGSVGKNLRGGGGYGGQGGAGLDGVGRGLTYGSLTHPVTCGSGGGSFSGTGSGGGSGGGSAILNVFGAARIDGTILARGEDRISNNPCSGGSGGTVNLTADTISGTGTVSVAGGSGYNYSGGGSGGRMALVQKVGTDFDALQLSAIGGLCGAGRSAQHGACGTIFQKKAVDSAGTLLIDSGNISTTSSTVLSNDTCRLDAITVTNGGVFLLGANAILDLTDCRLSSDSTTNSITSRIVIGESNGSIVWPAAYTNTGTISQKGTNVWTVATDLTLGSGGILTHETAGGGVNEDSRLRMSITGNLTIASNGAIWVAGRGYSGNQGPGDGDGRSGGGHGGQGGSGYQTTIRAGTYGSVTHPMHYGAGGRAAASSAGGGVALLEVNGDLTVNGIINADGGVGVGNMGGSAGGSINITAHHMSGTGLISASGGRGGTSGGGSGGGRIALTLTADSDNVFDSLNVQSYGGPPNGAYEYGAAGTVYLKGTNHTFGRLLVDNANKATAASTLIASQVTETVVGDVVLRNDARLELDVNQSLEVYGSWSNAANFAASDGSTVTFAGTDPETLYGSSTFANLVCATPGKTLAFEAGQTFTASNAITLTGAVGNPLTLTSTDSDAVWKFIAQPGSLQQMIAYLVVSNSDASAGNHMVALSSQDNGGNSGWIFAALASITWTGGAGSSLWTEPNNWNPARMPLADDPVITIAPATFQPTLDIDRAFTGSLVIQAGASLNLNGNNLTVAGVMTNAGTLTATDAETITLASNVVFTSGSALTPAQSTLRLIGTGPQTFAPGGKSFYAIDIANTGAVTVADAFSAWNVTFPATRATVSFAAGFSATNIIARVSEGATLTFGDGKTYTVNNQLVLRGVVGKPIVLNASGAWNLNVNGYSEVRYVDVTYSDARGGRMIPAFDSIDSLHNLNWDCTSGKAWAGTSTVWTNPANWSPTGVPGTGTVVLIDGSVSRTPRLTNDTTLAGLVVDGYVSPAALTIDMPIGQPDRLRVMGDVIVRSGGTLTHSTNNGIYGLSLEVGSNLIVAAGGRIDAYGCGYLVTQGPGAGLSGKRTGGGHGGQGGTDYNTTHRGAVYGSALTPTNAGSGAGDYGNPPDLGVGGGVVRLVVSGVARVDGVIDANGRNALGSGNGGGAGGSIWLTVGSLAGSGNITADGGNAGSDGGGGGGGRIAVVLTEGLDFGQIGFSAAGGPLNYRGEWGAGGTRYFECASDRPGRGILTVGNVTGITTGTRTQVPSPILAKSGELAGITLVLTNNARVALTSDLKLGDLLIGPLDALTLGAFMLRLRQFEHDLGDLNQPGPGNTHRVDTYSQVIWLPYQGTIVIIR